MLSLLSYTDYRSFLNDFYKEQKRNVPSFSIRYIASKTGVDPAHVARILKGKRHVSAKNINKFMKLCKLDNQECTYFECMVAFN